MVGEMIGVNILAGCTGAFSSVILAVAITDHQTLIETLTAGGLGAGLSILMVRWLLAQYNSAITRLSKLEDERAALIRETVVALTKTTDEIGLLVKASQERGLEVADLVRLLKERPCICEHVLAEWRSLLDQVQHTPQSK